MSNSSVINYKLKYQELKAKYVDSVDLAFRLGFEQGVLQAQKQQQEQSQMQQQQQGQNQIGQGMGAKGSPAGEEQMGNPGASNTHAAKAQGPSDGVELGGDEIDQHIAKLESMISKSDISVEGLKKALSELQQARSLAKSSEAISGIALALHKPEFKIGVESIKNMDSNAKQSLNMQETIVSDLMKAFEEEERRLSSKVNKVLDIEGILKGE